MRFVDWKAGMNVCLSTRRGAGVDKCAELGGLSTRTKDSVEGAAMTKCLSTRTGVWVDKCAELGGLSTRMQDSVERTEVLLGGLFRSTG